MSLGTLLNMYVSQREIGLVVVEKALVKFTRNSYEPDICYFGSEKAANITPDLLYYSVPLSRSHAHYSFYIVHHTFIRQHHDNATHY